MAAKEHRPIEALDMYAFETPVGCFAAKVPHRPEGRRSAGSGWRSGRDQAGPRPRPRASFAMRFAMAQRCTSLGPS